MIDPEIKDRSRLTKEEWRQFTMTVWNVANVQHPLHPAAFAEEIPRRLIKLFSFWGETVLDPFAGVGTTGKVAHQLGRRALLIDQSCDYVQTMEAEIPGEAVTNDKVKILHGDARDLAFIADNSIPLIVTSPPYWDKAEYGNAHENIGTERGYSQFLRDIEPAFLECARVLAPGRKLCVVTANVNQHTDYGLLTFPLASDFSVMLRSLGLVLVSEIIWNKNGTGGKWGSYGAQRPIFGSYPFPPNLMFKNVHEHILVFAKPPARPVKGRTVRAYDSLME